MTTSISSNGSGCCIIIVYYFIILLLFSDVTNRPLGIIRFYVTFFLKIELFENSYSETTYLHSVKFFF